MQTMSDRSYPGVFSDNKRKKCWIDPITGYNSFMLFARDLSITWGDDTRYWKWDNFQVTSKVMVEIAELINVCWLEVRGKCDASNLSPGVTYEVAFVVLLKDPSKGLAIPVKSELKLPNGIKEEKTLVLRPNPKNQWVELLIGEFETGQDMDKLMQFSLLETNNNNWKSGLVIQGVIFQPKICINKNDLQYGTVIARDLSIIWGDDQRYWRWYSMNETSNTLVDVAEVLDVCWLEVKGTFNTIFFTPEIIYEVVFVVMMNESAYGWEVPVKLRLVLPDGEKPIERQESLLDKPKGKFFELMVGEFKKTQGKAREIQFSLLETASNQWKKGLVIKSVIIRPKI